MAGSTSLVGGPEALAISLIGTGVLLLWRAPKAPEPKLAPLFYGLGAVLISIGVFVAVRLALASGV